MLTLKEQLLNDLRESPMSSLVYLITNTEEICIGENSPMVSLAINSNFSDEGLGSYPDAGDNILLEGWRIVKVTPGTKNLHLDK